MNENIEKKETIAKVMTGFLLVVITILTVFICNMTFSLDRKLDDMNKRLVQTQSNLLNLAVPAIDMPFQDKCTSCHGPQRFTQIPNDRIHDAIMMMHKKKPELADIDEDDWGRIEASVILFKSGLGLQGDTLRQMAFMPDYERIEVIRGGGQEQAGKGTTLEEAQQILRSYKILIAP